MHALLAPPSVHRERRHARGLEHLGKGDCALHLFRTRGAQHTLKRLSEALRGTPRSSSAVISGHQWSSVVISGHQWSSVVISGHQWSSVHLGEDADFGGDRHVQAGHEGLDNAAHTIGMIHQKCAVPSLACTRLRAT